VLGLYKFTFDTPLDQKLSDRFSARFLEIVMFN